MKPLLHALLVLGLGPSFGPACAEVEMEPGEDAGAIDAWQDREDAAIGPDGGAPADAAARVEADQYCETIASFFCPFYLRCGRMAIDPAAADPHAACAARFLETCNVRYEPRYLQLAEAGLLELSTPGIDACRQHLETVSCEAQIQDLDGACRSMWIGTQPAGSPCGIDVESFTCGPLTSCRLDLSFCGICTPVVADGEVCGEGVVCRAESQCASGVCSPRAKVGEACGDSIACVLGAVCSGGLCRGPERSALGESCGPARCPYGSACIGGTCILTGPLGASCDQGAPCDAASCDQGFCASPRGDGEVCALALDCASGRCVDDRCRPLPGACWD